MSGADSRNVLQGGFAARPWAVEPQSAELADASSRAYYAALHAARALLPPVQRQSDPRAILERLGR